MSSSTVGKRTNQPMQRTPQSYLAPAKLNLFLHVTGRRPDGYHLLQTAFQLIDYGDLLHFELRNDNLIVRTTEIPGVPEASDLIVRAAKALQTYVAAPSKPRALGANIAIEKRLPMGGGLGGGSSDAATTLIVLNHLWQTGLSRTELMTLGLQLGADVPFFIYGQNAFAEGVGEALSPLSTPDCWFVVIEPGVAVPTAEVFRSQELTRDSKPVKISDFSRGLLGFGKNDLQVVATKLFPAIAEAIEWLAVYGEARMTGSGACVFCSFLDEQTAKEVLEKVPSTWKAWTARSLRVHPLAHLVES